MIITSCALNKADDERGASGRSTNRYWGADHTPGTPDIPALYSRIYRDIPRIIFDFRVPKVFQ